MAKRTPEAAQTSPNDRGQLQQCCERGSIHSTFGFAIFDRDLRLVASNRAFRTLRGYPAALCKPGTELIAFYRFNAERGDYGPGDAEQQAKSRLNRVREREPHALEYRAASGQMLSVRYAPIDNDGLVLTYADITARKQAEEASRGRRRELQVALDNMPGALVYTDDDLNIVVLQRSLRRHVPGADASCCEPGRPYPDFLRIWPSMGTTATATSTRWSPRRVESLRNPVGRAFEDRTPDGRVYEIYRRQRGAGRHGHGDHGHHGTQARRGESGAQGGRSSTSRSTTCRARSSTPTTALNIVFCNDRFADMYPVPKELLQPGRPYADFLRYLAEHGYYGDGDVEALVAERVESLRNPSGRSFEDRTPDGHVYRIGRRQVASGGTVTVMTDITELKRRREKPARGQAAGRGGQRCW